uniref:Transposase n=1 Tax=Strongyloides venezuelensis TaxID=75913 RepID=A0A0K0G6B3_STRVS
MDKLSSNVDYQFCNRKVKTSRYWDHLRDTHDYADDRFLKLFAPYLNVKQKGDSNSIVRFDIKQITSKALSIKQGEERFKEYTGKIKIVTSKIKKSIESKKHNSTN